MAILSKLENLSENSRNPFLVDVSANYSSAINVVEKSPAGEILGLYGEDITEPYRSYMSHPTSRPSFNGRYYSISALTRSIFRGRLAQFSPFRIFMENYYDPSIAVEGSHFIHIDRKIIEDISSMDREYLSDRIGNLYVSSRKPFSKSLNIVEEAISSLFESEITGPVFVGMTYPRLSMSTVFSIWLWSRYRNYPLIVLQEGVDSRECGFIQAERDYLSIQQVIPVVADYVGKSESVIRKSMPFWASTFQDDARKLIRRGLLTSNLVRRVVNHAQNAEDDDLLSALVPEQVPALVEFEIRDAEIGIRQVLLADASPERAAGASRALRGLIQDVLEFGGLDNVIPNWRHKLVRIDEILHRISQSTELNPVREGDVIEFGVEISAFESRVHEARARIGELTIGEVLSLLIEARGFLGSFPQWLSYKASSRMLSPDESIESAEVAIQILSRFAQEDGVMSSDARERVESISYYEERDIEDAVEASAMSSSARNLAAAAARSLFSSAESGDSQDAGVKRDLAVRVSRVMLKNSGSLVRFAALNGERWLDLAVQYAIEHRRTN